MGLNRVSTGGDIGITIDPSTFKGILTKASKMIRRAVADAENEYVAMVFEQSQVLVPVDTGALKASGRVVLASKDAKMPKAEIHYGNSDVDYAMWVHEILWYTHEAPTQAKFVEQPALELRPMINKLTKQKLKEGIARLWL